MRYWTDVLTQINNKTQSKQGRADHSTAMIANPQSNNNNMIKQRKMFFLGGKLLGKYLTFREAQCVLYLLRGFTIVKTAHSLQLSPRTVEYYVNNIKEKIGVRTKAELVVLVMEVGFKC